MRTFLCDRASTKFFMGGKVTVRIMPWYIEYVFKIDRGFYGVVNLLANTKDKVTLLCFWGDYFKRMSNIPDKKHIMTVLSKNCPKLYEVLAGKDEIKYAEFRNTIFEGTGFVYEMDADLGKGPLSVIGDLKYQNAALRLINHSLELYWEIHDRCPLKNWVSDLENI